MGTNKKNKSAFPDILSDLIANSGKTLREIAKESGVGISQLSAYQSDKNEPNMSSLVKLSAYFDISVDCLVGRPNYTMSEKEQLLNARKCTGLSNANISFLNGIVEAIRKNAFATKREQVYLYAINEILGSQQFLIILSRIWDAYCIEHTRALGGLAPKYPDEKEAAIRLNEAKTAFSRCVSSGTTKERIVSGDVAISVLLNDAREAITSISKDIIMTNILESDRTEEGDNGKH